MAKHLRFDILWAAYNNQEQKHPQEVMKELGITYQHATPQSLGDQWWFWNCENIPDPLPLYLEFIELNPMDCIGWGLSAEDATKIRNYKSTESKNSALRFSMLKGKEIIYTNDVLYWAPWADDFNNRRLFLTQISDEVEVSTVFLSIPHSLSGFLNQFETMVISGVFDGKKGNYNTYDEAEKGHNEIVEMITKELKR